MTDAQLPLNIGFWLAALSPILVLLILLVGRRWETASAAPVALALAVAVALFLFETPLRTLAVAAGKGIWDAIFILYVIWPALALYNVASEAGAFEAMQAGVRNLMPDRLLVVLAFAWVLSSFIQSIAGFGTPLAVTVPLLLGLGVRPIYAVLLPMIGAAWANMFGSLGVTWLVTITLVDVGDTTATLRYTTALLWIPNLLAGLAIAWFYGRGWALRRGLPAILAISLIQGGLQFLLVPLVPTIGNLLASSAALLAVFLLNRWGFYRQEDEDEPNRIFEEWAHIGEGFEEREQQRTAQAEADRREPMSLLYAFLPYVVLTVLAIIALLVPPVNDFLSRVQVGLPFPATMTGYGVEREATRAYAAFTPLTHPGTLLLIAGAAGYLLYRSRGYYEEGETLGLVIRQAAEDALPATTAITALLLISKVMDHSGEITVLALGIAQVAPATVYAAASAIIGALGVLITSSNNASNILFAPLQATAARALGVPVELAIAGQSAGAATGNSLAPGDALLGATVAGISGRLGDILSRNLPWALLVLILVSAASVAFYLLL